MPADPIRLDSVSRAALIDAACARVGTKPSQQRRLVLKVLADSDDHPSAEAIVDRIRAIDSAIAVATVYRNLKALEEAGVVLRHDFGDGRSRFELADGGPHDHLIDMNTGKVIEFVDADIQRLRDLVARRLGYRLIGHRLELKGVAAEPVQPR